MYGVELRDKFIEICRADLISRILNKANSNLMLLRTHRIVKENVGKSYYVYNGIKRIHILIKKNMLGFKVGEFVFSKKIKNMNSSKTKTFQRFKGKKKIKRFRRRKQKKFIKSLKNNLIKLKKVVNIKTKNKKKAKKYIRNEYNFKLIYVK